MPAISIERFRSAPTADEIDHLKQVANKYQIVIIVIIGTSDKKMTLSEGKEYTMKIPGVYIHH